MGNMVSVTILTDFWHRIKEDPEKLVRAIDVGMVESSSYPRSREAVQGVQVQRYHHADNLEVLASHQNHSTVLSPWDTETRELTRTESGRLSLRRDIEATRWYLDQLENLIDSGGAAD